MFLAPPSAALPDVERGQLHPLVERLHAGPAGHHRAPATGRLGAGGLPPHRHRRHRWKEPGWQFPGALSHPQHRPADPPSAMVQAHGRAHGHRRLPTIQVSDFIIQQQHGNTFTLISF